MSSNRETLLCNLMKRDTVIKMEKRAIYEIWLVGEKKKRKL